MDFSERTAPPNHHQPEQLIATSYVTVQKLAPHEQAQIAGALILTLIPILLSALRIFAVANGDRPTLVTLLSTLDVKAVLLGTLPGCCPPHWGRGGDLLDSMAPAAISSSATQRQTINRALMAGGVHHDSGGRFVCLSSGQRPIQPALLCVHRVLLSQVRAKSDWPGVIIGAAFWCLFWRRFSSARRICGSRPKRSF